MSKPEEAMETGEVAGENSVSLLIPLFHITSNFIANICKYRNKYKKILFYC